MAFMTKRDREDGTHERRVGNKTADFDGSLLLRNLLDRPWDDRICTIARVLWVLREHD